MRFPDAVTVLRPSGADAYGNPGSGAHSPAGTFAGFLSGEAVYGPPDADVQRGDRLAIGADVYDVEGDPRRLRSPSKTVMTRVSVRLRRR
ncbi:hypothetical protein [Micromonospora sediminicola]|uniref:hypothetical protein n=1 Tax=Micromonospora sediminicola TaxID=946078 RepID=UPI0037B3D86C